MIVAALERANNSRVPAPPAEEPTVVEKPADEAWERAPRQAFGRGTGPARLYLGRDCDGSSALDRLLRFYASTSHRPERGVVIVTPAIEPGIGLDAATPLLESMGLERQWFSGPGGACFEHPRGATWVHLEPRGDVLRAFVWSRERSCGAEIVEGLERTLGMRRVGGRAP